MNKVKMDKFFQSATKDKHIYESVLLVENGAGDFTYKGEHGGKTIDSPLLMASISKLFTTTAILQLLEQGRLSLDDKLFKYLDQAQLQGLHTFNKQDYTAELTLASLLFQTSGLPDIFEEGKNSQKQQVITKDSTSTLVENIALTKQMNAHFMPNSSKQAFYADINFGLLGAIIEKITDSPLHEAFHTLIFAPLALTKTYLPISDDDFVPNIYYKDKAIHRPKFIQSCGPSGGAITTAQELMIFLKAFFNGQLFNKAIFSKLNTYRKLQMAFFPIQYGGGYMRIPVSSPFTLFMGKGELIGHSGSTGSFAYYYAEKDLYIVGDINQIAKPSVPVKLMLQIVSTMK